MNDDLWRFSRAAIATPPEARADQLRERFWQHTLRVQSRLGDGGTRRAVPLFFEDGEWRMLFTERAAHMRSHPGDVAFPGGKRDVGDLDDLAAAVREAEEEIGLLPHQLEVLGVLVPMMSRAQITCTPCVALVDYMDFFPTPNANEVSDIFSVPVSWLMDPANIKRREMPGSNGQFHSFDYDYRRESDSKPFRIWGLTSAVALYALFVAFGFTTPGLNWDIYLRAGAKL